MKVHGVILFGPFIISGVSQAMCVLLYSSSKQFVSGKLKLGQGLLSTFRFAVLRFTQQCHIKHWGVIALKFICHSQLSFSSASPVMRFLCLRVALCVPKELSAVVAGFFRGGQKLNLSMQFLVSVSAVIAAQWSSQLVVKVSYLALR